MSTCQLASQLASGSQSVKNGAVIYTVEGCRQRRRCRRKSTTDALLDFMERQDGAAEKLAGYGICFVALLYFGGHLLRMVI